MKSFVLTISIILAGCGSGVSGDVPTGSRPIDLDRSGEGTLLAYYLGAYVDPPTDPITAGILYERDGSFLLAPDDTLRKYAPALSTLSGTSTLDWPALDQFVSSTYYHQRKLPETVSLLEEVVGAWSSEVGWEELTVKGSMSPYERIVHVRTNDLMSALASRERSGDIVYPVGTAFVAEHVDEGRIVEWTLMRKREDGFWDFAAYDSSGTLSRTIEKSPDPLRVPIQCLGCHVGNRAFEPERSFPGTATDGPSGPRYVAVAESGRDATVVQALNEHVRRSDTVLGLYATVYLAELRSRAVAGLASEDELDILTRQGLMP